MKPRFKFVLRLALVGAALIAVVALIWSEAIDLKAAREWMQGLNPVLLIILMAVLPVLGFSVSITYLIAGAVFGAWGGLAVVTAITAIHLAGSHLLGLELLRRPIERELKRRKIHVPQIPPGEERGITVLAVLTPGPPYFLRNYALALSGIPFWTYFWVAWPIYVIRSCIVIFIGDFGTELTTERILILGSIVAVKLAICAFVVYRMRKHYLATHPTAVAKLGTRG